MTTKRTETRRGRTPQAAPLDAKPRAEHWQRPRCMPDADPHAPDSVAVYRFFNVPGALLYVGISGNPKTRFGQHSHKQPWWIHVATWTVEWYPDRVAAEAEETRAILDELPAYNLLGVPEPGDERDLRAEWMARFHQQRPTRADLDSLFLAVVRSRSLQGWPKPRQIWDADDALDVYVYANSQAPARDVHDHQLFIDRWNDEQTSAWHMHHGDELPQPLPQWSQADSLRVRVGRWLLGRSTIRQRERIITVVPKPYETGPADVVYCTATNRPIESCGCRTRHIADEDDRNRFGRPLGTPHSRRLLKVVA